VTRVVFLIVDALPPRHVNHTVTPTLARLAHDGRAAAGRAVMTSATYPNHATFATGVDPLVHGIVANWIVHDGRPRPSYEIGPAVPTIFDACRAAGRSSAAVVGDQHLVPVMGAHRADAHWPPGGELPDDVERDGHGYAADHEVLPRLLDVLRDSPDLVVAHLNEPDTAAHIHGPDSDDALACYHRSDATVATIVDALQPAWDDTVLIVVSDHDQEDIDPEPIDLYPPAAATGLALVPIPEGSAAIVWGRDETDGSWLDAVDGVAGHAPLMPDARLVWGEPRRWFTPPAGFLDGPPDRGTHGGPRTRNQVAIVAGGAPRRPALPDQVDAGAWAATVLSVLNIDRSALHSSAGSSLLPNT
jgi:arylsulfatase A-like enzyme